jgi:hypothetical protein
MRLDGTASMGRPICVREEVGIVNLVIERGRNGSARDQESHAPALTWVGAIIEAVKGVVDGKTGLKLCGRAFSTIKRSAARGGSVQPNVVFRHAETTASADQDNAQLHSY